MLPLIINDILDQHIGMGLNLEDLILPINHIILGHPSEYSKTRQSTAKKGEEAAVTPTNKNKFNVQLDVQQFKPEEITVKVSGHNTITVEGKHEEKEDEHGFISRHFIRRYVLPDGHDIKCVVSNLSSDGILSITAPWVDQSKEKEYIIPVQQTGLPLKPLQDVNGKQDHQVNF